MTNLKPPVGLSDITPEWLTSVLVHNGIITPPTRVDQVQQVAYPDRRWMVVHLELTYGAVGDQNPPTTMWMQFTLPKPTPIASLAGQTQVAYTQMIAPRMMAAMDRIPALRPYAASYEESSGRYFIIVEDPEPSIGPFRDPFPLTRRQYEDVVDSLATIHAFWWDHPDLPQVGDMPTPEGEAQYAELSRGLVSDFCQDMGRYLIPAHRRTLEGLADVHLQHAPRRLTNRNLTVCHGNLDRGSIVLPSTPAYAKALLIGMEYWYIGIGPSDLATLLGEISHNEYRRAMERHLLRRYHQRLVELGVDDYPWTQCWNDYVVGMTDVLMRGVWQWVLGLPPEVFWRTITSALSAYEDLGVATAATHLHGGY